MTITRSYGTPVTVGGIPYLVGNGGEGKTPELDNLAKQCADWLAEEFGKDVEIRFNSDRESGGAWLKNSLDGFAGNCQVGLGASLWSNSKGLYVVVYLDISALKDKAMLNRKGYYCQDFNTFDEATADLLAKIDRSKIYN